MRSTVVVEECGRLGGLVQQNAKPETDVTPQSPTPDHDRCNSAIDARTSALACSQQAGCAT